MRIIGGTLGGRVIPAPPGDRTRPTTDVLKESLFSALEHKVELRGITVVDLCAGSGGLAFEALSRGAARAILVDASVVVCKHLRTVANDLHLGERVVITKADAVNVARSGDLNGTSLVFADPPYAAMLCNRILGALVLNPTVAPVLTVVLEHGDREAILLPPHGASLWHKTRGETVIDVVRYERPVP
jgi:16S rRNA (guanine966-N2)-methyltransferase